MPEIIARKFDVLHRNNKNRILANESFNKNIMNWVLLIFKSTSSIKHLCGNAWGGNEGWALKTTLDDYRKGKNCICSWRVIVYPAFVIILLQKWEITITCTRRFWNWSLRECWLSSSSYSLRSNATAIALGVYLWRSNFSCSVAIV